MCLDYSLHSFYDFKDFTMLFLSGEISPIKSPICVWLCTSTFYRRATRFSIARLKLYYRPLDDGNDTRFAQGSWHVMGFCIPRNFGSIYLLLQCTAAEVCVKSVLKISGLELSHLLWVTQVESLNLSHSCWVTWAQEYTKYVKNHFHISSLWTLNLEGFDN